MKLIWHLSRKDFRHFRGRWAFWVGVLLLKTLLGFGLILAPSLPSDPTGFALQVLIVLIATEVALTVLLAALIVQDDPPPDGHSPWQTRPIPASRLLLSKLLSLVLLLGLPGLVLAVPLWLACGAGAGELAWMASGQLVMQLLLVLPAASLGALTRTPGRFLIGVLVCLLALPLLSGPALAGSLSGVPTARVLAFVFYLSLLVTLLPLAVASYLERRPLRLAAVGVASVVVVAGGLLLAQRLLSGTLGRAEADGVDEVQAEGLAGLQLEFASMREVNPRPGVAGGQSSAVVSLVMEGRPADSAVHLRPVRHSLSWPDGSLTVRPQPPSWSTPVLPEVEVRRALGLPPRAGSPGAVPPERLSLGFSPGADALERLRGLPADYRLLAEVSRFQPEITRTALADLRRWRVGKGRGQRLLAISNRGQGLSGVEILATEFLTPASEVWGALTRRPGDGSERLARVALLNRRTGAGVPVVGREEGAVLILGVRFFRWNLIGGLTPGPGPVDDVDVVSLRWRRTSVVRREVLAPGIRLSGAESRPPPGEAR